MRSDTAQLHSAEPEMPSEGVARLVRLAGWALVAAVAGAAAWAVVELLSRDVTETDARVIVTSLGFAAASTTGASGVAALMRDSAGLRALGVAALGCSIAAFLLFAWIVWEIEFLYDIGVPEWGWRACGCSTVLAIAFGHASLMLRGRKPTDTGLVQVVIGLSLLCGAIDAGGALLPLTKIVDDVDESWARILGAVLVLLIATTMLAPLLRRLRLASARDRPQQTMELAA
jgi:hypothetical protein